MSCGLYTVTKAEPSRYVEVALYVGPQESKPGPRTRARQGQQWKQRHLGLSNSEREQRPRHTARGKRVTRKY
jgi:hypothetical protein